MKRLFAAWGVGAFFLMHADAQTNLLTNPDFQSGEGTPADWTFESGAPETFEVRRVTNYFGRSAAMEIRSLGADTSGYLVQMVPVKSSTWHRFSVMVRQRGGRGLLWINALDARRQPVAFDVREYLISFLGHPLVPRFVSKERMRGSDREEWREAVVNFFTKSSDSNAADIACVKVNIGSYFSVSHMWFSDARLIQLDKPPSE
ncbi:MAG: hypothetical protein HY360_03720 [Verrucomicrobia bacterium]|nr:hypothetical protein [Verrucomicrobiota bacterium]